jgi:sugar phosphate permease
VHEPLTDAKVRGSGSVRRLWKNPLVVRYFLVLFTFDLSYWGFTTWLPSYLVKARGFSTVQMGIVASFPFLAGTVGGLLGGWLSDRFFSDRRRLPIIGSQLVSAALLFEMFVSTSTTALIISQTLAGFSLMLFFGLFWALPMNTVEPAEMGVTGAFINLAGQIAAFVAPLAIGYLVDLGAGGFGPTFIFLISTLLLSCAVMCTIPRGVTGTKATPIPRSSASRVGR